jgi:DNA-binding CsgD family transcriptional regulator
VFATVSETPVHGDVAALLSPREQQVVSLVIAADGPSNEVIATSLGISPNTLKTLLRRIYRKTGANTRMHLALMAIRGFDK